MKNENPFEELGDFFASYAKAVQSKDVMEVSQFWTIPALTIVGIHRSALTERPALIEEIKRLFEYHDAQGISGVKL